MNIITHSNDLMTAYRAVIFSKENTSSMLMEYNQLSRKHLENVKTLYVCFREDEIKNNLNDLVSDLVLKVPDTVVINFLPAEENEEPFIRMLTEVLNFKLKHAVRLIESNSKIKKQKVACPKSSFHVGGKFNNPSVQMPNPFPSKV